MRKNYIKPETEVIYMLTETTMGIKDSEGEWNGGDANTGTFNEEEELSTGSNSIWEN